MIEQSWIDNIFKDLQSMDINLDTDPLAFGPDRLNSKVAEVRKHLSRTENLFLEISHNLQKYKRDLLLAKTECSIEKTRLMSEDPYVRSGRSQPERDVLADQRLVDKTKVINSLEITIQDLEAIDKVVKAKRADLKDIQNRLKDQLKICQEQIGLGQRWGKSDIKLLQEFNDRYEAPPMVSTETPLPIPEPKPLPASTNTVNDIDNFFNAPIDEAIKQPHTVDALDLDDLFKDI